tara:strand:- start:134 stop:637 length:504 start_codon:yes stop_codon:yes gene_type:complete
MNICYKAIEIAHKNEGGYVFDPDDPGGETNMGISKRAYPDEDIKNLSVKRAKEIYYDDYWKSSICPELDEGIAIIYFDAIVHSGNKGASRILQRAINSLMEAEGKEPIKVDGIAGKITQRNAVYYGDNLVDKFIIERIQHYASIANRRKASRKFLRGWVNRALSFAH